MFMCDVTKTPPHYARYFVYGELLLRVNITIVYEHTVSATSAFSMCTVRVVLTSFCYDFSMTLQAVKSYCVCFWMIKS